MKTLAILLSIVLFSSPAYCLSDEDLLHGAAHTGASYTITHLTHVVCKEIAKGSKLTCTLVAVGTSTAAGVAKEIYDGPKNNHTKAYVANAVGIGLATVTIIITW